MGVDPVKPAMNWTNDRQIDDPGSSPARSRHPFGEECPGAGDLAIRAS
jgi:hypothetical protein